MDPVDAVAALFEERGRREYFGEVVSVSTHMLQTAALAARAGAPDALIVAALLHDVGHLLSTQSGDDRHEQTGAEWLSDWLPAEVTEPIRLHVAAKRYLCAADAEYVSGLSAASAQSLELQGGPMNGDELRQFETLLYAADAVAVRRWDDLAKDPTAATPPFDDFRPLLRRLRLAPDETPEN